MRRSFLTIILWLILLPTARAGYVEIHVSPTNLDTVLYSFSVSTNATDSGVAFHVTITHKRFDIYPDSSADVGTIEHTQITNAPSRGLPGPVIQTSFDPLKPAIPVALKKEKRVWTADFTASRDVLQNTNACFVFTVPGFTGTRGDTVPPSLKDIYELKLQDFAKP